MEFECELIVNNKTRRVRQKSFHIACMKVNRNNMYTKRFDRHTKGFPGLTLSTKKNAMKPVISSKIKITVKDPMN